jgi:T5orf172 domain
MIVYVLSNPAMPGLVKIGRTDNTDANSRIGQLYTTGVPVPFTIEYACKVENPDQVEKALHIAFAPQRINPKREFFQIDPAQAIAILRLLNTEDATEEVSGQSSGVDLESEQAAVAFKAKRPNMNFTEMGIPEGSVLHSVENDFAATVVGPKKVRFQDEEMSLTAATRIVLGIEHSVQPSPYWTFNGRSLLDIYNDTYTA